MSIQQLASDVGRLRESPGHPFDVADASLRDLWLAAAGATRQLRDRLHELVGADATLHHVVSCDGEQRTPVRYACRQDRRTSAELRTQTVPERSQLFDRRDFDLARDNAHAIDGLCILQNL